MSAALGVWNAGALAGSGRRHWLDFARGGRPDEGEVNARALLYLLLVHAAAERTHGALFYTRVAGVEAHTVVFAVTVAALCIGAVVLSLTTTRLRLAAAIGCVSYLAFELASFPHNANHGLVVVLALGFLTLFDLRDAMERNIAIGACCWLTIIVLAAAGVQKVLHGAYFQGEYLAVRIASGDSFAAIFQYLLPEREFLAIREQGGRADLSGLSLFLGPRNGPIPFVGDGLLRFSSWQGLAISNGIWLLECTLPVLLLVRRTRTLAAWGIIGLLVGIEVAAREWFFGLLYVGLVLLFLPGEVHRRVRIAWAMAYLLPLIERIMLLRNLPA